MQQEKLDKITVALFSNSATAIKEGILEYVTIEDLFELSLYHNERIAFRAAWHLEHVVLGVKKYRILHYQNRILNIYSSTTNWSVLRSITKIIMEILKQIDLKNLSEDDTQEILNKTFQILENSDCPIAVRCNGYDILASLAKEHDWIIEELKNIMQLNLEKNSTAALVSRSKRIFKKLR